MEYVIMACAIGILIVLFWGKGWLDFRKEQQLFKKRLLTDYGKKLERQYKPEQYAHIPKYFEKHKAGFFIDEITWSDLGMDDIFKQMNYTHSSAGEEYLYALLRTPQLGPERLTHMEEVICYYMENPKERAQVQFLYSRLGGTGKFSLYDYLDYLDDLGERSNRKHYLSLGLLIGSLGLMLIHFSTGLLIFLGVIIYNNISYFAVKKEIEPYLTSFAYVFRLLDSYPLFQKHQNAYLQEEFTKMEQAYQALSGFRRGSGLVMSGTHVGGSGNPLDMLMDFIKMGFHIDLIQFNRMLREIRSHTMDVDLLLTQYGFIEACIAIGEYRTCMGTWCVPDFVQEKRIYMENGYHPMVADPVGNTFETSKGLLITGSNASGKSTFLKTVAINALLAQSIHTCMADRFETSFFRICSSMSLRDDVLHGESYYMVEIRSIKRILDLIASDGADVLCFVDEVLRGTNTVERIAASSQILKSLNAANSLCFVATHDIELTHLLEESYENYHFSEDVGDEDVCFSYRLLKGRATTRNAIRLLSMMGYEERIVNQAEQMADSFLETSKWQMLD